LFDANQMEIAMTKKHRCLYVIVVFGLLYQGCAQKDEPSDAEETEITVQTVDTDTQGTAAGSIQPGIGVGKVKFGMSVTELEDSLGKPDIDATGFSYVYADLGIEVVLKDDKVFNIVCVQQVPDIPEVKACECQTAEGIGIGSSEPDIITAYNEPTERRGSGYLIYKNLGLGFKLENDQVQEIIVLKPL
jgi:hypothetical protein